MSGNRHSQIHRQKQGDNSHHLFLRSAFQQGVRHDTHPKYTDQRKQTAKQTRVPPESGIAKPLLHDLKGLPRKRALHDGFLYLSYHIGCVWYQRFDQVPVHFSLNDIPEYGLL